MSYAVTIYRLATAASLIGLAACSPLESQYPILSATTSTPSPPYLGLRAEIIPSLSHYHALASCEYSAQLSDGMHVQSDIEKLGIRRIRDRLLVTSVIGTETSTALISPLGYKFDYNAADGNGRRLTPREFSGLASNSGAVQMNSIDLYFPPLVSGPIHPGDVVSRLRDARGDVRVVLVYRGIGTFKNREAVLVDLIGTSARGDFGPRLGFSIIDRYRAVPLLFAMAGGISVRSEQMNCTD